MKALDLADPIIPEEQAAHPEDEHVESHASPEGEEDLVRDHAARDLLPALTHRGVREEVHGRSEVTPNDGRHIRPVPPAPQIGGHSGKASRLSFQYPSAWVRRYGPLGP